jgi:hypothetical protein
MAKRFTIRAVIYPGAVHDYYGFATMCNQSNGQGFQQSCDPYFGEESADMFLGWVYGKWEMNPDGSTSAGGTQRANFLDVNMAEWINTAKNNNR